MNAYDKLYLEDAMANLAVMLDYGTMTYGDTETFFNRFLVSDISKQFGAGNPRYISGMSGIELAESVMEETGGKSKYRSLPPPTSDSKKKCPHWADTLSNGADFARFNIVFEAVLIQTLCELIGQVCVFVYESTDMPTGCSGIQTIYNQPTALDSGNDCVIRLTSDIAGIDDDFALCVGVISKFLFHGDYLSYFLYYIMS